jgi:plastocyanin
MRRALVALGIAAVALAAPSSAAERGVSMPSRDFVPPRLEVLVGDTVKWTNSDTEDHDVAADDGSFSSGRVAPGGAYSVTFTRPGKFTHICLLHPRRMKGEIEVYGIFVRGPAEPVTIGKPFELHGLAPPEAGPVTIERRRGSEFGPVGRADVAADGAFRIALVADESAEFRAVAGSLASDPTRVGVSPRLAVSVRRKGGVPRLHVVATPPQPRAPILVEVYSPDLIWVRFARGRLDAKSRAVLAVRPRRTVRMRVVMPEHDDRFARATSNEVIVRRPR